jgi:microcin C transport system permease protein
MSFLSPVNQARWARFRHNRRGYWSLWLFMLLFVQPVRRADRQRPPAAGAVSRQLYVPALKNYSETTFGGPFATAADYQDPWLQQQLDDNGWVLWAPLWRHHIDFATQTPFLPALDEKLAGYRCQRRRCAGAYFLRHAYLDSVRPAADLFSSVLGVLAGAIQGTTAAKSTCGASALLRSGQACQRCS